MVWLHAVYSIPAVAAQAGAPFFGGAGVDVFFVISGFIMVALTARENVSPPRFLARRLLRVAPLYWLATLGALIYGASHSRVEVVKSALFVPYATHGSHGGMWPILPAGWTLNYEMAFYLLFGLSLVAPRRTRVLGLAALLALFVLAGRLFGPFEGALAHFYTSPLLLEFAGGMLLAQAWLTRGAPRSLPLALAALVIGLCSLGAHSSLGVMSGAFLTVAAATHPRLATLSNRPLLALGNASYSIYLSHGFIQDALAAIATHLPWRVTWISSQLYLLVTLAVCAVLGLLCYRYLERPLTTRLRGSIERRLGAKAHAASSLLEKAGALGKPPPYPQR